MFVVETLGKIRRFTHTEGKSLKATGRELGISRKVLRTDETDLDMSGTVSRSQSLVPSEIGLTNCCLSMKLRHHAKLLHADRTNHFAD